MSRVVLKRVVKRYGDVTALEALDLEVQEGEFLTLLGPSGCGKTTTLRLIAGFIEPTSGSILIDGEDMTMLPPNKRRIGMVFQDYALFPHLTIEENIGFGLREHGVPRANFRSRVAELLELVRLPSVERRYPAELSGGQQQRVALARAVAYPPRVLLMDEPLGALDLKLRETLQVEVRRIQQELKITTIYVTHDQTEAMMMSDRIAVLNQGRLIQLGSAEEIYNRPRTKFVADFIGNINFLQGRVVGQEGRWGLVEAAGARLRVPNRASVPFRSEVTVAIRPQHLKLFAPDADCGDKNVLRGTVTSQRFAGNILHVVVEVPNGPSLTVEARPDDSLLSNGDSVFVAWEPGDAVLLDD